MTSIAQRSFSGGEVAPELYGRVDHLKYATGLRTCRNMVCMRHGGVMSRPGSVFVAEVADSSNPVRLIPFIFNLVQKNTYLLEFSNKKLRFYQNGGQVVEGGQAITNISRAVPCVVTIASHGYSDGDEVFLSGISGMTILNGRNFIIRNITTNTFSLQYKDGNTVDSTGFSAWTSGGMAQRVYTISTPYVTADLSTLRFAQTADIMTIVHPNYAPRELQRSASTNWSLVTVTFGPTAPTPSGVAVGGGTVGNTTRYYGITTVDATTGEESYPSSDFLQNIADPAIAGNAAVTLSWNAMTNAGYYRIYRAIGNSGVYGFIGQATTNAFSDVGPTPDFTNTPPFNGTPNNALFASTGNYPSTVAYIQQRRVFGNSNNAPTTLWLSKTGLYKNFSVSTPNVLSNDAITFIIATDQVDAVQHVVDLKGMLVLSGASEAFVQGDSSGIIKPTAINPQVQSWYGCGSLRPLVIGDTIVFQQARGWFVRDLAFDFSIDGYRGNDLTVFSTHLFENHTIVDWDYQKIPHSVIWAIREDGILVGLTYIKEQQILAWHRHDLAGGSVSSVGGSAPGGFVENIAVLPESGEDGVYLCVKRTVVTPAGTTVVKRYIERLSKFEWPAYNPSGTSGNVSDVINAISSDCTLSYDGTNYGSATMTLLTNTGSYTYADLCNLNTSVSFFTSSMVGDQIFLNDALGNQIRCTINAFVDAYNVTVYPNRTVSSTLQGIAVTNWAHAIKTVTNIWPLNGLTVSVWADRFVVGSPNNRLISSTYTVANGQITLDKPYSVIYVGLPITSDIETLDIDTSFGESLTGLKKNMSRVSVYVNNTRGFFAGTNNPETNPLNADDSNNLNPTGNPLFQLYEKKLQADRLTYDAPPQPYTQPLKLNIASRWNHNGRVFIRQVDPIPTQILSITPAGYIPAQSPYYVRV